MKPTYFLLISILIFSCLWPALLGAGQIDYSILQKKMIENQIVGRGIMDQRLLAAFEKVKRHLFLKPELWAQAYDDSPLAIGEGQSISEPYIVAVMTSAVDPAPGKKVLEIGTGSGYHAAILAELVENVYTIELIEKLGQDAQKLLDSLGYKNIKFKIGDGYQGWEKYAPYDGIIVTCSEDHIPEPLIKQLAVGGRLIIPVRYSSKVQELIMIEKEKDGELKKTYLIPVQFVPLIRGNNK